MRAQEPVAKFLPCGQTGMTFLLSLPVWALPVATTASALALYAFAELVCARLAWQHEAGAADVLGQPEPAFLPVLPPAGGLAATAVLAVAAGLAVSAWLGSTVAAWALAGAAAASAGLFVVDARHKYLPDALTWPLALSGLWLALEGQGLVSLSASATAFLVLFAAFQVLASGAELVTGSAKLGGGDVVLAGAIGAWLGLQVAVVALVAAAVAGLLWGLLRRRSEIAFGPWMFLGTAFALPASALGWF